MKWLISEYPSEETNRDARGRVFVLPCDLRAHYCTANAGAVHLSVIENMQVDTRL